MLRKNKLSIESIWFAAHPGANFRVRDAKPGEVAELAGVPVPPADPAEGFMWRVAVIKLGAGRFGRMLCTTALGTPNLVVPLVVAENRIAID